MVDGLTHHTENAVTMEWRSSVGDSCLDYEYFQFCEDDGSYGEGWATKYPDATYSTFAVDSYDASQACCYCGGGDEVPETATPAPTTSINTLGGRYVGNKGTNMSPFTHSSIPV
jgi:hypothetical protein